MKLANLKISVMMRALSVFIVASLYGQAASALMCSTSGNIAGTGVVSQSTTFRRPTFSASNAINGNFADTTATKVDDSDPYWKLRFDDTQLFESIELHNRDACCQARLRDITISIEDGNGQEVYKSELLNPENSLSSPEVIRHELPMAIPGRKIFVSRTPDPDSSGGDASILSLAEVEVNGCPLASSLILPEVVEPDKGFAVTWTNYTNADYGLSPENAIVEEIIRVERIFPSSDQWHEVHETDNNAPFVDRLFEEGRYRYRIQRSVTFQDGDDDSHFTVVEPQISLTVTPLVTRLDNLSVYSHGYHFVDSRHEGDSPIVYGLVKDTDVYWQGASYKLDAGELLDIGSVSQGDVIESSKPLSIGSTRNGVDMPVPIEFSGLEFAIPLVRGTHYIHVKNANDDAVLVEYFDGANRSTLTIPENEIVRLESDSNGFSATISSLDHSKPLLVSHSTNISGDSYPVAPAALELFGVRTGGGRIGAVYDDTKVFQYADNGAVLEQTIDAGEVVGVIGNIGSDGAASFVRIIADKPIGASQIGDSDGGEQTAFIPQTVFAREYVLPVDTQYVAMGCFGIGSTISVYNPSGELQETTICSSTDVLPGKAFLGSVIDGPQFTAGSRIESTEPIYLIYENALLNDETNLMGSLLTHPHGYHFVSARHEGDRPAVYGIVDNTDVYWKGDVFQLNAGQFLDIGIVAQGDVIESSHALAIGSNRNGTDMPVPVEFAGTQFAIPLQRDTHYIYVKNIHDYEVEVNFFNGSFQGGTSSSIDANSIRRFTTTVNGVSVATVESVDNVSKLLVSHVSDKAGDAYPVPALAKQVYGVRSASAYIGSLHDETTVTQYASSGEVLTSAVNRNIKVTTIGDSDVQGLGSFVKIEADKPVAAVQHGDGDGGEQTAFIPETMFAREFVLPVDTQYVVAGCVDANVEITIYGPNGLLTRAQSCNSVGGAPGSAYFGGGVSVSFEAGSRIESTEPIYVIYEASATNDEHNLMGEVGEPLEVRPSTFVSFSGRPLNSLFDTTDSFTHSYVWSAPEFDSNLYTLLSDNTVIQRLNSEGIWVTQAPESYSVLASGRTRYTAREDASGLFQYRLRREFTLGLIQNGVFPLINERYVEEPSTVHVLGSPPSLNGFSSEGLSQFTIVDVPSISTDGNYRVSVFTGSVSLLHEDGRFYNVSLHENFLLARALEGGPHVELDDGGDGIGSGVSIENQPAGVYEYSLSVDLLIFFEDEFNLAVSEGFITDTRSSRRQYITDLGGFNGNTTHTITVDTNTVIEPEVRGPGSPDEDSDGDGVNDAFDPYPLQNNTQCFP